MASDPPQASEELDAKEDSASAAACSVQPPAVADEGETGGGELEDLLSKRSPEKARRNTVILHSLPEDATEDELKAIFTDCPESKVLRSLKPDVNNTAFVAFETDEAAQNAALWLRSQKFRGAAIKCSMKSEHLTRSFFRPNLPQQTPPAAAWTGVSAWSSHATSMQQQQQQQQPGQWAFQGAIDPSAGGKGASFVDASGAVCMGAMPAGAQWSNGWMPSGGAYVAQPSMQDMQGGCSSKGKGSGGGRPRQGSKGSAAGKFPMQGFNASLAVPQSATPVREASREQIHGGHSDTDSAIGTGVVHGLEGLQQYDRGYSQEFRQYSRTEILDICSKVTSLDMPESFQKVKEDEHDALLFRAAPCEDWAPAPSPRMSFTFNNGAAGDRSRSNTEDGGSAATDAPSNNPAAAAAATWANQREEVYQQGSWNTSGYDEHWGGSTYDSWSSWSRGGKDRWWSNNNNRKGGGATSSQSRHRWVEKNAKEEEDGGQWMQQQPAQGEQSPEAAAAEHSVAADGGEATQAETSPANRTPTWAEKARGLADSPGGLKPRIQSSTKS
mmetsp:Transcript_26843/g.49337  ORF Transcript_26843/g.49337 Transcript_26843/m.49337 type:complete len:555 (+) Transcript_26843:72-1736(+)